MSALLDDSGGGLAAVASVARCALPAWICPRHLHDRPARMRSSLATVLVSWSMLAGLGLVFAQLIQLQSLMAPGYVEVRWAHTVFSGALALSGLAAGLGGLPLWLLMLRRTRREHCARDTLYLLMPVLAPAAYLAGLAVTGRLAGGPDRESLSGFLVVAPAGFAAAAIAAIGPGLALRRLQPQGPALRLAAAAAAAAAAIMAAAATAIAVAEVSVCLWARQYSGYDNFTTPGIYLIMVIAAASVTTLSAARGARAALAEP